MAGTAGPVLGHGWQVAPSRGSCAAGPSAPGYPPGLETGRSPWAIQAITVVTNLVPGASPSLASCQPHSAFGLNEKQVPTAPFHRCRDPHAACSASRRPLPQDRRGRSENALQWHSPGGVCAQPLVRGQRAAAGILPPPRCSYSRANPVLQDPSQAWGWRFCPSPPPTCVVCNAGSSALQEGPGRRAARWGKGREPGSAPP